GLWNLSTRQRLGEPLEVGEGAVRDVAFRHSAGGLLAAGYAAGEQAERGGVVLWDPESRQRKGLLEFAEGGVHSVSFCSDGRHLAASFNGPKTKGVVLWDIGTRQRETVLETPDGFVTQVAFSPTDPGVLAVGVSRSNP